MVDGTVSSQGLMTGKVAVVIGVGDDLGRATALTLSREGADVVLVARTTGRTAAAADQVRALGRQAWTMQCDITDADQCEALAQRIASEVGRVDSLVLVPAATGGGTLEAEDKTLSAWRAVYEVNVFGTMQVTKALLDLIKESGDGRIVVVNTSASERGLPGQDAYASSKAAVQSLTRTLAAELGEWGVKVNGVHPGTIVTSRLNRYFEFRAAAEGKSVEQIAEDEIGTTVLGYLADCDDVAGAILFFASPLSRAVTGQALHVNSGQWPIINHPPSQQSGLRARDRMAQRAAGAS